MLASDSALATFYTKTREDNQSKLAATYLVSGEIKQADRMDIDDDNVEEQDVEYEDDGDEEFQPSDRAQALKRKRVAGEEGMYSLAPLHTHLLTAYSSRTETSAS